MSAPCPICQAETEDQDRVWYAYATRLRYRDAFRAAVKAIPHPDLTADLVKEHLQTHHWVQPSPPGKLIRSMALQEALTSFPRHVFFLLLAIYRAGALSERQIYRMFYLDHAEDSRMLTARMELDLRKLVFRSFLYKVWPENASPLGFDDPGPFFFLNSRACPVVEKLEGMDAKSMPFGSYVTSISGVKEFYLERDVRFNDVIVALRSGLYGRSFMVDGRDSAAHLGIEHWFGPVHLFCELPGQDGPQHFAPSGLTAFRVESRDGSLSTLLPLWLEYDRGTSEAEDVVEEIFRYAAYYSTAQYKERFPRLVEHKTTGPLLVLCEDAYRREELQRLLDARLEGRQVPIYLTERPTLLRDAWGDDVLVSTDGQRRFALMDRLIEHNRPLLEHHAFSGTDLLTDPSAAQLLAARKRPQPTAARAASGPSGPTRPGMPSRRGGGLPFSDWGGADITGV